MTAGKVTGSVRRLPEQQADVAPLRFVSAASLFDGHDAAINIIRRLLQAHGAEVVHLGHNRSVADIVSPESLTLVRETKRAAKAAAKTAKEATS